MGISVVIPVYNEKENIEKTIETVTKTVAYLTDDYEIIIVDDASRDGTGEILDKLSKNNLQLRVIHLPVNTKYAGAFKEGLKAAKKDVIFYTDADNPIDMSDLKRALSLLEEFDMIIGKRVSLKIILIRHLYSQVYNWLVRKIFKVNFKDFNFAFKLFKRKILDKVTLESKSLLVDPELIIKAFHTGARIKEIDIRYYPRVLGKSKLGRPEIIIKVLQELVYFRKKWRNI